MSIFSFLKKNKETTKEFISRIPYNSEVDPIAEATVYMAYGRVEQAKDILLQEITKNPQNKEALAMMEELENNQNEIKDNTVIFNSPSFTPDNSSLVRLKKTFLVSLMVKYSNDTETCPDNFEFESVHEKDTKQWQKDFLKEIEVRQYCAWAHLSTIEIKE